MVVEASQFFGSGGSPSSDVLVAPQTVTLTGSWAPFAVTVAVPAITGKTLGSDGNDCFMVFFWTSAGSNFNARTNSLGIQTIGVDLWGVHIKVGTHTTAATDLYKQPELGPELQRCQRYYETGSYGAYGQANGSGFIGGTAYFRVTKRVAPTTTVTGAIEGTTASVGYNAVGSIFFFATSTGSYSATWTASAEL
jgi:hypothetical protein